MRHERALVAIAFLVAAVLRLVALSGPTLSSSEAVAAWRAARAATHGEIVAEGVVNPFLTSAQAGAFALVEPNVFLARLPAALCGLALVLVPLLVRGALRPPRALALSILAAVDPTLVLASREGVGASAAVLAAALAVAGLLRWAQASREDAAAARRWALFASAATGTLLTAGPEAWSLAPLVGLAAVALRPWRASPARGGPWAAAFAAGVLLPSTAGLWAIPWASGVSASLTVWLQGLAPIGPGLPPSIQWMLPLAVLALLGFALGGARPYGRPLGLAVAWSVLFALNASGSTVPLAVVLVVAASGLAALAEPPVRRREWGAAVGAAAAALVVQAAFAARAVVPDGAVAPLPGLEALAADLERVAIANGREASELPVRVLADRMDPELGWALRASRRVAIGPLRPQPDGPRPALVARVTRPAVVPPGGYVGATYDSSGGRVNLWVPLEP